MTIRSGRATAAAIAGLALATGAAHADEEKRGFSGTAGFGYLAASGNSDTTAVNGTLDLFYDLERWHHTLKLLGTGTSTDGDTSGERYTLDYEARWDRTDRDYFFGLISYEKDNDSGVREKLSETIGYGREIIDSDPHLLTASAGIGFQQIDFADGTDDSSAILRLGGDYKYTISETANFTSGLAMEIGADNTYTVWKNAVSARLSTALSLTASYTIKNNSDAPVGTDDTDTFTAIRVEYGF